MRALLLLGRFLDMGSWAVDLALSVGIFPYVLKLLQTTATDLRQILVFIWTKILALDKSCQVRASTPLTPLRGAFTRRVSSQRESRGFAELAAPRGPSLHETHLEEPAVEVAPLWGSFCI